MGVASVVARNVLATSGVELGAVVAAVPWDLATSSSGAELVFPPRNVATGRPGRVCRFKNAGYPAQLTADLPAADTVDTCALINHNLTSSAVVSLAHAATLAGPWTYIPIPIVAGKPAWAPLATSSRRYYRLIVDGPAPTTDGGPVQIGEWWLGARQDLPPFLWGAEQRTEIVDSFNESEYGVPTAHFLSSRRTFSAEFEEALDEASALALEALKSSGKGRVRPMIFLPDVDNRAEAWLGRLGANAWRRRAALPGRVSAVDFSFHEDPFGKTGA